ncbi:MAG: NAD-dependent epimerase/dehydratase family protein [Nitrospirae bacterium]|nr:NAD-dependent epimerase/dehydratase family protein [Nitrospirota bacterium]
MNQRVVSEYEWKDKPVLVTGGTSFIGSNLVRELARRGAKVSVVDDLSSGKLENLEPLISRGGVQFTRADLNEQGAAKSAAEGVEVVFHLAADHGGRGYVDLHQAECASNLVLDGLVFRAAVAAGVKKIVFASSGCVYPNHLQRDPQTKRYLRETDVGPPYDADNMYGWAKLMAEMTLVALHKQFGVGCASCRFFTVYGPRGVENHAVMAMIARAFVKQDPFEVWGTGEQIRNWTYVDDIVEGTLLAAEKISDGTAVNLGTMERIRVLDAVNSVIQYAAELRGDSFRPRIVTKPEMPTGPVNRVADNSLAEKLLGWKPRVAFHQGLKQTMDWYFAAKTGKDVEEALRVRLTER